MNRSVSVMFTPFRIWSGAPVLVFGLVTILTTAMVGWRGGIHADGVLDLHYGPTGPFWLFLLQGLVNWLFLFCLLAVMARWLNPGRWSAFGLLATQAAARWPLLPASLLMAVPSYRETMAGLNQRLTDVPVQESGEVIADTRYMIDAGLALVLALPVLAALAWMIWLMFHAYVQSTGLSGQRAFWSFVGALIAAEILSKLFIVNLLVAPFTG